MTGGPCCRCRPSTTNRGPEWRRYDEPSLYHRPGAETLGAALRGVRLALGDGPAPREFGVAVYVDFTTTAEEWATHRDEWAA